MKYFISLFTSIIFLLTSCSPATTMQLPTDVPTSTTTVTPPPTTTPQPTNTPKPTATATMIAPSETQMQEILANAEVEFSVETTNTYTNAGVECTIRYSKDVLEGTGIDYIQYPEGPMKFMCDNLIAKVLYTQRENVPELAKAFQVIPADGFQHYGEVYEQIVAIASAYMEENGTFPVELIYKSGEKVIGNINEIELNNMDKDDFLRLKDSLDSERIDYLTFPDWFFQKDENGNLISPDRNVIMFFQHNKLVVYGYNLGKEADRNMKYISRESGLPLLANLDHVALNSSSEEIIRYDTLTHDYIQMVFWLKAGLLPQNYDEMKRRTDETQEIFLAGAEAFYGGLPGQENFSSEKRQNIVSQTLNHP